MEVHDAHRPAAIHHDQLRLLHRIEQLERLADELVGPHGLRFRRHHLLDFEVEQVGAHVPAQVAIGDNAHEVTATVGDADAAEGLAVISAIASDMRVPTAASGISLPVCMISRTNLSIAPRRPPGWNLLKSTAVKPRLSSSATASASPSAACISVEVVGARLCGQASLACGTASTTSAARPSVLSPTAVTAMSPMRKRRE